MYIVFDFIDSEFELVGTEERAKTTAEEYLQYHRDDAPTDGWPEEIVGSIGYAEVKADSRVTKTEKKSDAGGENWPYDFDEIWYVDLVPVKDMVKEK